MKKHLNSKTSLGYSVLSLILCVSMLLGTTFAWFTDVAVSSNNKIASGELKIDLEMLVPTDGGAYDWQSIKESAAPAFNYNKWEPGYTDVKLFKVENYGSLDLKWKAAITSEEEFGILADVIDVYVITSDSELTFPDSRDLTGYNKVGTLKEFASGSAGYLAGNLLSGQSTYFGIALMMRTDAGNEYQDQALPAFDIRVIAGQLASENDSYDNQYDADAVFPEIPSNTQLSAPVGSVDSNNNLTDNVNIGTSNDKVTAEVPAGVTIESGATELVLGVKPLEANTGNIALSDGQASRSIDVHIDGISKNNTTPITVNLGSVLPTGLKNTSVALYHIENGTPVAMELVDSFTAHNQFTYDKGTGNVTIYVATFSAFVLISDPSDPWDGTEDTEWMEEVKNTYDTSSVFSIDSPEKLAALGTLVAEGYDFAGKTVKITKSLDLGGHAAEPKTFYPIGYRYSESNTDDSVGTFRGTLDGDLGTTKPDGSPERARIFHLSQSTWAIQGHYDNGYYNRSLGLFAHIEDATIKNLVIEHFEIEGEFAETGCIAGGASGGTFDHISFYRNDIATYNTGVGALVGWDWGDNEDFYFHDIHIDDTNNIRALWGSWDVACGGLMGFLESTSRANISDCIIAPKLDVFNDVCANYQYYQYRYSGMLIGTVGRDSVPKSENITCSNVKVYLGDWTDYYYCEFVKNSQASYTEDFQFSRVEEHDIVFDLQGNPISCTHNHDDEREDRLAYHLPFSQLYTGYSWGAQAVYDHPDVKVLRYDYTITYFDGTHVVGAQYVLDNSTAYTNLIDAPDGNVWVDVSGNQITSIPAGTDSNVMLYLNTLEKNMIRFVDKDGFVISEQIFEVGKKADYYQANIVVPAVPNVTGYVGVWPDYITMLTQAKGDIVIHPVYSSDPNFNQSDIVNNLDINSLFDLLSKGHSLTMYQDLSGSIANASKVTFGKITDSTKNPISKDARLDLESYELKYTNGSNANKDWTLFNIVNGSSLTIGTGLSNGGTLKFVFDNLNSNGAPCVFDLDVGGKLVLERGVTIEMSFNKKGTGIDTEAEINAVANDFVKGHSCEGEGDNPHPGLHLIVEFDQASDYCSVKIVVTGDTTIIGNVE